MEIHRDDDGYLPIAGYGVIGDGRTTALVGVDGHIDWWAVPTLDSPPVCAALLDPPSGGRFVVAPASKARSTQRYIDQTNILETVHETPTGAVKVIDSLNTGSAGRLPWTELARRIEGVRGEVEVEWSFTPGHRLARSDPWVFERNGLPLIVVEDQMLAVITDRAGAVQIEPRQVRGRFTMRAGETALVAVVATDDEPLCLPPAEAISARIDRTADGWRRWSDMVEADGDYAPAIQRSILALKLLLTESSGAIAAAATTSLPESVGGPKNWDYRYSWVRDSSFALDALIQAGLDEEVHGAVSWLLSAIRRNGGDIDVFYTLGGERPKGCADVDVPGWRQSRPVRSGNEAAGQTQLGVYGDLLDTVWRYSGEGHRIDQATGRMLADLADRCCDKWRQKDSGIWELYDLRHYTISKIGCWTALERAGRLARAGQIPDGRAARWALTAAAIHDWVNENCWSEDQQSYTFYAGTEELDAAVLLAGRTGFDRGPRLSSTIDAVRRALGRGPLIYRYSGMDKEEGAFVACSFWTAEALVHAARVDEARELMSQALGHLGPTGLLSEQIDPDRGEFLGNIPQALSHLALVNAAYAIRTARTAGPAGSSDPGSARRPHRDHPEAAEPTRAPPSRQ